MGLLGDIQELTPLWKLAPWRVKIVLVIGLFLAVSSIASLSEDVANWKGFILTGLEFYQTYIRDPFFSLLSKLTPLIYSDRETDTIIILGLYTMSAIRSLAYGLFKTADDIYARIIYVVLITIYIALFFYVFFGLGLNDITSISELLNTVFYLFLAIYISTSFGFLILFLYHPSARRLLTCVYLLLPPIIVCILAAINLGLRS